jgi:hypothetical protein
MAAARVRAGGKAHVTVGSGEAVEQPGEAQRASLALGSVVLSLQGDEMPVGAIVMAGMVPRPASSFWLDLRNYQAGCDTLSSRTLSCRVSRHLRQ